MCIFRVAMAAYAHFLEKVLRFSEVFVFLANGAALQWLKCHHQLLQKAQTNDSSERYGRNYGFDHFVNIAQAPRLQLHLSWQTCNILTNFVPLLITVSEEAFQVVQQKRKPHCTGVAACGCNSISKSKSRKYTGYKAQVCAFCTAPMIE